MAKKGSTFPWKVDYAWPNGSRGTLAWQTEEDALLSAERQRARISPSSGEADCAVSVEYREPGQYPSPTSVLSQPAPARPLTAEDVQLQTRRTL